MMSPLATVSLVLELLSWIGITVGTALLIAGYARRLAFSGWVKAIAVIVPAAEGEGTVFRWLGDDGHLYELPADTAETVHLEVGDDVELSVNPRRPEQARTDEAHLEGRTLRRTGWLVLGIGVAAVVLSLILMFVG
jgi:F0F1-type ATP synthase membrane subunit c/vacuolar-type H+-ATPase subunit K